MKKWTEEEISLLDKLLFVRRSIRRKRYKYWKNKEWMYEYVNVHFID